MNQPRLFGIYTARFPYLETDQDKLRPVVVLSQPYGKYNIIAILPLTSKLECEGVDYTIGDWRQAGLLQPSTARVHRITALLAAKLSDSLGDLSPRDRVGLQKAMKGYLNL